MLAFFIGRLDFIQHLADDVHLFFDITTVLPTRQHRYFPFRCESIACAGMGLGPPCRPGPPLLRGRPAKHFLRGPHPRLSITAAQAPRTIHRYFTLVVFSVLSFFFSFWLLSVFRFFAGLRWSLSWRRGFRPSLWSYPWRCEQQQKQGEICSEGKGSEHDRNES